MPPTLSKYQQNGRFYRNLADTVRGITGLLLYDAKSMPSDAVHYGKILRSLLLDVMKKRGFIDDRDAEPETTVDKEIKYIAGGSDETQTST